MILEHNSTNLSDLHDLQDLQHDFFFSACINIKKSHKPLLHSLQKEGIKEKNLNRNPSF